MGGWAKAMAILKALSGTVIGGLTGGVAGMAGGPWGVAAGASIGALGAGLPLVTDVVSNWDDLEDGPADAQSFLEDAHSSGLQVVQAAQQSIPAIQAGLKKGDTKFGGFAAVERVMQGLQSGQTLNMAKTAAGLTGHGAVTNGRGTLHRIAGGLAGSSPRTVMALGNRVLQSQLGSTSRASLHHAPLRQAVDRYTGGLSSAVVRSAAGKTVMSG